MQTIELIPTPQQQAIIDIAKTGKNILINAGAGSAKTSTCRMVANEIKKKSLYVAFNKSIQMEAFVTFPEYVDCRTMSSIAYQHIVKGTKLRNKVKFIVRQEVSVILSSNFTTFNSNLPETVNSVLFIIKEYCNSDKSLWEELIPELYCSLCISETEVERVTDLVYTAKFVWGQLISENTAYHISHEIYLKLFQLTKPKLDVEIIYFDEFQDTNPVILDILRRQDCQRIFIGDQFQAIYGFLGAVNAFEDPEMLNFEKRQLTQSFRFGRDIAEIANKVLGSLDAPFKLVGLGTGKEENIKSKAIIVRTNLDIFNYLINCYEENIQTTVNGDLTELFSMLYSAHNLKTNGDPKKRFNKYIAGYKTWKEFFEDSKFVSENMKIISILNTYPNIYETIANIKKILIPLEEAKISDLVITTAHKAKGLEWDHVTVGAGFIDEKFYALNSEKQLEYLHKTQTGNLIYVAVTRAKIKLELDKSLVEFLEYFA